MSGPFETNQPGPRRRDLLNQLWSRQAGGLTAVSSTPMPLGTGTRVIEVGPDLQFVPGQPVRVALAGDPAAAYMDGVVASYAGSMLTVEAQSAHGTGMGSAWIVTVTGAQGPAGGLTEADLDARLTPVAAAVSFLPIAATKRGQVGLWLEDGLLGAVDLTPALRARVTRDVAKPVRLLTGQRVPLAVTANNLVPLWLEGGLLAALGMTPALRYDATRDVMTRVPAGVTRVPLMHDKRGAVPLWWEQGLATPRLSESFKRLVLDAVGGSGGPYAPAVAPAGSGVPTATDGRSLYRLRAKLGDIATGATAQLRIGFTGDSWTEFTTIPFQMRAHLEAKGYTLGGEGWQSVNTSNKLGGVSLARSAGWTFLDGSNLVNFDHGASHDGFSLQTAGAEETLSLINVRATRLRIFYRATGGAFRWRVDSGEWSTVTAGVGGALSILDIPGLADAQHRLDIDTQGNTGTVMLCGFHATHAPGGVVVEKCGNAGLRSNRLLQWTQYIQDGAAALDLDVLVVILGTNDFKSSDSPPAVYIEALSRLAAAYRAATPNIGLIFVVPAESFGNVSTPLWQYRDALYRFCIANGYELFNQYDQFGMFAQANPLGQWVDNVHLGPRGARNLIRALDRHFFNL